MNTLYVGWELDGMSNLEILDLLNSIVGVEIGIDEDVVGTVTALLEVVSIRPEYIVTKLEFEPVTDDKSDLLKKLLSDGVEQGIGYVE